MDISGKLHGITARLNQYTVKSTLKKMSKSSMYSIKISGIRSVDIVHNPGEVAQRCLDEKMIMIVH